MLVPAFLLLFLHFDIRLWSQTAMETTIFFS